MKKIFLLTLTILGITISSHADHGPRIQFIHNSKAESVEKVDIWYNWSNTLETFNPVKIEDDFRYKEATAFSTFTLVYGDLVFYVTPEGSTDTSETIFRKSFGQPQIDYEESFVIVLNGDADNNLEMILNDGKEQALDPGKTSLNIFHGSFDAPQVNIVEISIPAGPIVNNIKYKESSAYLSLDAMDYILQVQTTEGIGVADFAVPLSSFAGSALFVAATGYLDTTGATPNEAFKLLVATTEGDVVEINPMQGLTTSRVQVIHNSADEAAEVVDVWLNDQLLIDDFEFRMATPFIDAPAGEEFTIAIKGSDSQNPDNPIWSQNYTLEADEKYIMVANGIVSGTGYDPLEPFDIYVYDMAREEAANAQNTDVLVFHGSTDAPVVDIVETGIGAGTLVDNIAYSDFRGYLELPTDDYYLSIRDESGTVEVADFSAPLASLGLDGEALVVVASGFLSPDNNNGGEAFGLWVAPPAGGSLSELMNVTSVEENIFGDASIEIYPNPATEMININFSLTKGSEVNVFIYDLSGRLEKSASFGSVPEAETKRSLNLSDLESGLYILSIQAENSVVTSKIQISD